MNSPYAILVAEDDPAIADAMTMILETEGYSVRTTDDTKVVRALSAPLPDLILLDIWLSGADGRDVCKYLKGKKSTAALPIIMVSASRDVKESAKAAGADDFIAKPFEMDELLSKVKSIITKR